MNEKLIPRSRDEVPRTEIDPILSDAATESLKAHLNFRLQVANEVSRVEGIPVSLSIQRYTDIYDSLGIGGRMATLPEQISAKRKQFQDFVDKNIHRPERLFEYSVEHFLRERIQKERVRPPERGQFEPFSYEYFSRTKTVRIHFSPRRDIGQPAVSNDSGPLSSERADVLRQQLTKLFADVKVTYPEAERVLGLSWLYNLPAYCRLFPSEYTENKTVVEDGYLLQTAAVWGQFMRSDISLNEERARQFLDNLKKVEKGHVSRALPLKALEVGGNIQSFYKFYGIE